MCTKCDELTRALRDQQALCRAERRTIESELKASLKAARSREKVRAEAALVTAVLQLRATERVKCPEDMALFRAGQLANQAGYQCRNYYAYQAIALPDGLYITNLGHGTGSMSQGAVDPARQ